MTFDLKQYKAQDIHEIKKWWEYWRWSDRVHPDILSNAGFIVSKDNKNLCVGWLYTSNSPVANLNLITANPFEDKKLVDESLNFLIECLSRTALQMGYKIIMTTISNKAFGKRLTKLGFTNTKGTLTHYLRTSWD